MSVLLADIDATCSSLGFHDGTKYYKDEDTMQSLKVNKYFQPFLADFFYAIDMVSL